MRTKFKLLQEIIKNINGPVIVSAGSSSEKLVISKLVSKLT
jgi:hypothetical protein